MAKNQKNNGMSAEDRFSRFMFGSSSGMTEDSIEDNDKTEEPYLDYEAIMNHIDTLMTSLKKLKPLFNKAYPYIEQIWKKS